VNWEALDISKIDRAGRYKLLTGSVVPRPIAWVTTCMEDGRTNLAPFSQFVILSTDPGLIGFTIGVHDGARKDTLTHIEREREMVINSVHDSLSSLVQATSEAHSHDVSEVELFGIATLPSKEVRPPRLAISKIQFECRVTDLIPIGGSVLVVGAIVLMHIEQGLRNNSNHIDQEALGALARIGGRQYSSMKTILQVE
jgi:flavin reductase (DIM6/NTAB) family NADH-FMN oxidoreductase RutF